MAPCSSAVSGRRKKGGSPAVKRSFSPGCSTPGAGPGRNCQHLFVFLLGMRTVLRERSFRSWHLQENSLQILSGLSIRNRKKCRVLRGGSLYRETKLHSGRGPAPLFLSLAALHGIIFPSKTISIWAAGGISPATPGSWRLDRRCPGAGSLCVCATSLS